MRSHAWVIESLTDKEWRPIDILTTREAARLVAGRRRDMGLEVHVRKWIQADSVKRSSAQLDLFGPPAQ